MSRGIIASIAASLLLSLFSATASAKVRMANYNDFSETSRLNYEVFEELMNSYEVTSVEGALEQLKTYYPGHFGNYILMYKSRSLQESSYLKPRVLLFDRSAQFIISFNGDPKHRGYNRLEIMQYRPETAKFEFREVVFPYSGGAPEFSEANPQKCMACHQSVHRKNIDPRPNWEPYNTWLGAYGSMSGRIEVSAHDRIQMKERKAHPSVIADAELESEMADKFFAEVQPEDPRYKFLDASAFSPERTTELTQFLGNLNFRRVVRIVTESMPKVYEYLEKPFINLIRCQRLAFGKDNMVWVKEVLKDRGINLKTIDGRPPRTEGFIHRDAKRILGRESKEWDQSDLDAMVNSRRRYWRKIESGFPEVSISDGLTALFEAMGVDTSDWSMDFQTGGSLAFTERFGVPSNTKSTLRTAYVIMEGRESLVLNRTCEETSDEAAKKIDEFRKTELFQQMQHEMFERDIVSVSDVKARCVKCHTDDTDPLIPFIPFDNDESMKLLLKAPAYLNPQRTLLQDIEYRLSDVPTDHERMPMGPLVDRKIRSQLVDYYKSLVKE